MKSRGIRNNNPGNIDFNPNNKWVGQIGIEEHASPRFAKFSTPEYGIRALAKLLMTYQSKHKLHTIEGIINRWAPTHENNTSSYVREVSKATGKGPKEKIDTKDIVFMEKLVKAIIKHENGSQPYEDSTIILALKLAGL